MAAKRKSRGVSRSAGAGFAVREARREAEAVEPAAPAVLPGSADGAGPEPSAPKAGPVARGSAPFAGVGRGRGAAPSRRYAFRRS